MQRPMETSERTRETHAAVLDSAHDARLEIDGGVPVLSGDGRSTMTRAELDAARTALDDHGLVVFRGFELSTREFRRWTEILGAAFTLEKKAPDALAERAPSIGLHTEQAFLRSIPTWVWFFALQPAPQGGDTVLCDGSEIYSELGAEARDFLEHNEVMYWKRSSKPPVRRHLQYLTDPPGLGRDYRDGEATRHGDYYEYTYICKPLIYSRVGRRRVFGNHILNSIEHGYKKPPRVDGFHQTRLVDRKPLPEELLDELRSVSAGLSFTVRLERRDVLWVDNTRILHGRKASRGPREILVRKCFHADQVLPGLQEVVGRPLKVGSAT